MVAMPGLAIEMMYMKGLLDKLHIKFDVVHIGDFKTAGESMVMRQDVGRAEAQSLDPILDEFYGTMVSSIAARAAAFPRSRSRKLIDKGVFYGARRRKEAGLVDRIEYRDQFVAGMKAMFPGKKVVKSDKFGKGKGPKIDPNNPMAAFSVLMHGLHGRRQGEARRGAAHRGHLLLGRHHLRQQPVRLDR